MTELDGTAAARRETLFNVLRRPGTHLQNLRRRRAIPLALWSRCVGIAVLGSILFGLSLIKVHPELDPLGSSLWFTLSAGVAWILFGPILWLATGLPWKVLAQACLVTMVYGEMVLITGACFQSVAGVAWISAAGVLVTAGWILLSNLVMAAALAAQLSAVGISFKRSLLLWIFGLNGLGAAFFYLLRDLARGGV